MDIRLKPELEAMIQEDLQRGPYASAEDLVEQAVSQLHEREDYLARHRAVIAREIEDGWRSAKQEPLMDAEEVEAAIEERMKSWRNPKL
jgi:Arc/MetJ-type ribon-helix-helix transcriptional regulator